MPDKPASQLDPWSFPQIFAQLQRIEECVSLEKELRVSNSGDFLQLVRDHPVIFGGCARSAGNYMLDSGYFLDEAFETNCYSAIARFLKERYAEVSQAVGLSVFGSTENFLKMLSSSSAPFPLDEAGAHLMVPCTEFRAARFSLEGEPKDPMLAMASQVYACATEVLNVQRTRAPEGGKAPWVLQIADILHTIWRNLRQVLMLRAQEAERNEVLEAVTASLGQEVTQLLQRYLQVEVFSGITRPPTGQDELN